MYFDQQVAKINAKLKTTTVRNFDGGWNVIGDDLAKDAVGHALGRNDSVVAQRRRLNLLETA